MSPLVLVTGGSGYFGSLLVRRLVSAGRRVRVLDVSEAADLPSGVEFVKADILEARSVRAAVAGADAVFHSVAMVPLARDKRAFFAVNRDGTGVLLEEARRAGVRKTVHLSSSAVFGVPARNPVDDGVAPAPLEDYGRAKLEAEDLCRRYAKAGLDVTIIRPRTILGHGRLGIMQILFEWVREGYNVPVLGRGDNVFQFVHAEDLAEACWLASERAGPAVYNVGAERFGTMRETLEGLVKHAGTGSRVRSVPMGPTVLLMRALAALRLVPLAPYHWLMYGRAMYFDLARTKAELGWSARHGNVEMICESYDWYLRHREELARAPAASPHRAAVKQGLLGVMKRVL